MSAASLNESSGTRFLLKIPKQPRSRLRLPTNRVVFYLSARPVRSVFFIMILVQFQLTTYRVVDSVFGANRKCRIIRSYSRTMRGLRLHSQNILRTGSGDAAHGAT